MTRKQRRLYFVLLGMAALGIATLLVMRAVSEDVTFFVKPSELSAKHIAPGRRIRLGGLVEVGSVVKDGKTVTFKVTDNFASVPVTYVGILPDLFREGQGVVIEGKVAPDGLFLASEVLAKHDEKYMPKEVAEALKQSGDWQGHKPAAGEGQK